MIKRLSFLMLFAMVYIVAMAQGSSTNVGQPNTLIPLSTAAGVNTDDALNKLDFYVVSNIKDAVGEYTCEVRAKSGAQGDVTVPAKIVNSSNQTFKVVRAQRFNNANNTNKITSVVFPEGLTSILDECFNGITNLTSVTIPSTVTTIGKSVFVGCTGLKEINVTGTNFKFDKGALLSYDGSTLYYYLATNTADSYTTPAGVTKIVQGAFTDNPYLKDMMIRQEVSEIEFPAIYRNANMTDINVDGNNQTYAAKDGVLVNKAQTKVLTFPFHKGFTPAADGKRATQTYTIPEGIKEIGENAFLYCTDLQSVDISEGTEKIDDLAFSSCSKLQTITLPTTCTTIEGDPFYRCMQLVAFNVADGNPSFGSLDGVLTDNTKKKIIRYPLHKGYDSVTKMSSYDIPEGIEEIGSKAFTEASLNKIEIPTSVKKIDSEAFSGCTSLQSVTFDEPCSLTTIEQQVFQNCTSLTSITIPSSITSIEQSAFYRSGLQSVTVEGTALTTIGNQAFGHCDKLESFTFENQDCPLTTISLSAFGDDVKLKSFTFPKTVTDLQESAFSGCTGLETITFPEGSELKTLGKYVFNNCNSLNDVQIPSSVTSIGALAFSHCANLTTIHIPATTTSISTQAFEYCYSLTSFVVDNDNPTYSTMDGMLTSGTNKKSVLYIMPPGRANSDYTLLPTINEIGSQAFYQNKNLTNISIPGSVTKIDNAAFEGCTNLQSVTLMSEKFPDLPDNNEDAFSNALTKNAVLYYRVKAKDKLESDAKWQKAWNRFSDHVPSFNYSYTDKEKGRERENDDRVEYIPLSTSTVAVVDNASVNSSDNYDASTKRTLIIPETVYDGNNKSYIVRAVYDNAFIKNPTLKVLTFLGPISYIGVNAFHAKSDDATPTATATSTADEGIYFVKDLGKDETLVFSQHKYGLDDNKSFNAFADGQKIYVNPKLKDKFDAGLAEANQTDSKGNALTVLTKIPYTGGANANPFGDKLSTLCREFAVQFNTNDFMPYAEVPGSYAVRKDKEGYNAIVKASSIDNGVVSAFQAVIVKKKTTDDSKLYYQIADEQSSVSSSTNKELIGLYEDTFVKANTTNAEGTVNKSFGMNASKGIFYPMSADAQVKAFRSYLSLSFPNEIAAKTARIAMMLSDDTVTGIDQIETVDVNTDYPVYDLSGRMVAASWKQAKDSLAAGIYIVNGKKMLIK